MKNFAIRAASGLTMALLIVWGVLWSKWFFFAITLLIATGTMWEFYSIIEKYRPKDGRFASKYKLLTTGSVVVMLCLSFLLNHRYSLADIAYFFPVLIFTFFTIELYAKSEKPFENVAWNILSLCYILLPFLVMYKLYFDLGKLVLLAAIFLSWYYDSFCYIFGTLIGRHKLFERISPKKSIEGLIGGSVMVLFLTYFYPTLLPMVERALPSYNLNSLHHTHGQWLFLGVMVIIGGTYGDLIESLFKRSIGIKDSGSVLPGHGGFLDRLDAILMALPFLGLGFWIADQWTSISLIMNILK